MKRWLNIFVVTLISFMVTSCNHDDIAKVKMEEKYHDFLMDSIYTLDTLTTRLKVRNNTLAVLYARQSLKLAVRLQDPDALITAYNALGNANNGSRPDSSFKYYSTALRIADSCGIANKKPTLYFNLAMIYFNASNLQLAISLVDSSINLAEKFNQQSMVADALNSLGSIRLTSGDSLGAKKSFERAFDVGIKFHLFRQCGNAMANLALYEIDPVISVRLLRRALNYYIGIHGVEEETALVYINLGYRNPNTDSAIACYTKALKHGETGVLEDVMISAYNNLAYSYIDKKDVQKAEECIETALPFALKQTKADWLATLYDTYSDVLKEKGEIAKALDCQKKAYKYRTVAGNERSASQVRLLSAMLDLRNKDSQIRQKEEDLKLRMNENAILKFILATSILTVITLVFVLLWFRQRTRLAKIRSKMIAASRIIELEEMEKRRLGFELHDHVGYLVRTIHQFIREYNFSDLTEKKQILEKIAELRESIRRFSHRLNPIHVQNEKFPDLLRDLINDFSILTGMNVTCVLPEFCPELTQNQLLHLIRIVQELLANASRHASGCKVNLQVGTADQSLVMVYRDNGPGFDPKRSGSKGFGTQSIEERILLMEGSFVLDSHPGGGTKWEFIVPLHKPTLQHATDQDILH
ncbi:MAG: tetratricopeptide repeat protein [bacterium]